MLPHWIGSEQKQSASPGMQAVPAGDEQSPLLAQQGSVVEQVWPANAHTVVVPMSGGGGARQLPIVEPGGMLHRPPAQQSAVVVQVPLVGTHAIVPQCRWPVPSGTQGVPLQQSAAEAHAPPEGTQAAMP